MRTLSTQELSALVGELRWIEGFFIDKFYELGKGRFRLRLSRKGEQQANVQIILSRTFNKTQYVEQGDNPTPFAMAMRKRVTGFMIEKVEQYNKDRIILLALKKGDERANVVAEMFGAGNLIVTDKDMKITLVYEPHEYRDRKIKIGETYAPPKSVVAPKEEGEAAAILWYDKSGRCVDYSFFGNVREGLEARGARSLQEALDIFYHENPIADEREKTKEEMLIEELQSSIEKQENQIRSVEGQIGQAKEAGDRIFASMRRMNELIAFAEKDKHVTKEELQKAFPEIRILNVDLKDKAIEIELD